jgi:putative transposase
VRDRLRALAAARPRRGSRRLQVLVRRELSRLNHKRVQRLDWLAGLAIRRRTRKQVARVPRGRGPANWRREEAWAVDCMHDVLADGRRFRTLHVPDTPTRERLAIAVDTSLPGNRVGRLLDQLVLWHRAPKRITLDNDPEFTGQALDAWADAHQVTLDVIDASTPMQNGYREGCNGTFRNECWNVHWFRSLADARPIITAWKEQYQTERPQSALGGRTPLEGVAGLKKVASLA